MDDETGKLDCMLGKAFVYNVCVSPIADAPNRSHWKGEGRSRRQALLICLLPWCAMCIFFAMPSQTHTCLRVPSLPPFAQPHGWVGVFAAEAALHPPPKSLYLAEASALSLFS